MTHRHRTVATVAVGVLAAVAVVAGASTLPGAIGTASAQATTIDSCTTIDSPGTYTLGSDIRNPEGGTCIEITASNVVIEGGGHVLAGSGGDAVHAAGIADAPLSGVVVRDLTTVGWDNGTRYEFVQGGEISGVTAQDARMNGIRLKGSDDNALSDITLRNNTETEETNIPGGGRGLSVTDGQSNTISGVVATRNKYTVLFDGGSDDNVLQDYRARDNTYAVYFFASSNNRVENVTSINNEVFPIYTEVGSVDNVFEDFRVDSATMFIRGTNFALKPVPSAAVETAPSAPEGQGTLGQYVQLYTTTLDSAPFSVRMAMSYSQSALGDAPESSVSIWRYQNGSWTDVPGSSVDAQENTAAMELTNASDLIGNDEFSPVGIFAPLAEGTTNPPTQTPVPTPVNTPTPTPAPTTTATAAPTDTATETATPTMTDATTEATTASETDSETTGAPTTEEPTTEAMTTDEQATTETATTATAEETTVEPAEPATDAPATDEPATDEPAATETTSSGGPGFGLVAALAGLLASVALLAQRRR